MLFIDEVVRKIWEDNSSSYQTVFQAASGREPQQLYEELKNIEISFFEGDMLNTSALVTSGCTHHVRDGFLSGCSMCDLHSEYQDIEAQLAALKRKDPRLYVKVLRESFENKRGIINRRSLKEYLLCHNFLDEEEIPQDLLPELFGANGVYKKRPMFYEFETSVRSITPERLDILERYAGKNGIWFRLGLECENEWLRNHWLNKNTSDAQISEVVRLCKERGHKITGNVMIGLPGLTEEQSLNQYQKTIEWLTRLGIEMYSISVMNRKELTLQGFMYRHLKTNKPLIDHKIVNGEHTGLPWLFTVVRALRWGLDNIPDFRTRLAYGQLASLYIPGRNYTVAYNGSPTCQCFARIYEAFQNLVFHNDWGQITALQDWIQDDPCYREYLELIELQENLSIADTIRITGMELAKMMWPSEWRDKLEKLDKELSNFTVT